MSHTDKTNTDGAPLEAEGTAAAAGAAAADPGAAHTAAAGTAAAGALAQAAQGTSVAQAAPGVPGAPGGQGAPADPGAQGAPQTIRIANPAGASAGKPAAPPPGRALQIFRAAVALFSAPQSRETVPGIGPFEQAADDVMSRQGTHRAQQLVRVAVAVVVLLIVWAGFARVDEVTRGEGKVVPSRQLQVLQALDGGVVAEILVREGQVVEANQLLLRIDGTRATSGVRESAAQGFALQARGARLRALAEGTTFKPPSPSSDEERHILEEERRLYQSKMSELSTLISISRQQLSQRQEELGEMHARRTAALRGLDLTQQELTQTRPLLATGAVSQVEILRLEREVSRGRGDAEGALAQIARVQASIGEAQRKIQETELTFRNEARRDMAETIGKLNALNEGSVALVDKVDKASVRSPVRGRVQRLLANTVGGVVQPGKDIVEVVPLDDNLVLEARVLPRDIAFIHPGQAATVKLTAYDFSIYGGLAAKVENISPDTVVDEKGNAFYVVRVRTTRPSFDEKTPVIPGMTAEVDVLTGNKTVLAYLLKPVLKAKAYALSER